MTDIEAVLASDRDHVWHPWGKQGVAGEPVLTRAAGCRVWDAHGNRYLDLGSQLVFTNAGHQHPRVIAAIIAQAERLATAAPNYAVEARSEAARLVAERAPDGCNYVFFTTGGTEAVENAIRAARAVTGRRKILSSYRSYHGNTTASITATGDPRRFGNEYGIDHVHFFSPHLYRSAFWAEDPAQESARALDHLRQVITFEGPDSIAAVLLETVIGAGGVIPPPPGYLAGVRALCDEFGILLVLDEVMAGFGRTGRWFAFEHDEVVPDIFTVAKGINAGAVPLGAVVFQRPHRRAVPGPSVPRRHDVLGPPAGVRGRDRGHPCPGRGGLVARADRFGPRGARPGPAATRGGVHRSRRCPRSGGVLGAGVRHRSRAPRNRCRPSAMAAFAASLRVTRRARPGRGQPPARCSAADADRRARPTRRSPCSGRRCASSMPWGSSPALGACGPGLGPHGLGT